jgi:formimidoylglutamate deiminase
VKTLFQPELLYARGEFHAGAGLLVDGDGCIVSARTGLEAVPAEAQVVRLAGKALLPGFVNVHSHSFQRLIRGRTESRRSGGRDFWSWRGAMYHAAASLSPEQVYRVARMAFLEMALAGTTTVGEFHYMHRTPEGGAYDDPNLLAHQVIAAAQSVGIRIALLRTAYRRAGFGLPPDPGQTRFLEPTEEFLANVDELRLRHGSREAWVGVAPHSVRAVPIEEIEKMAAYAREHGLPLHMHVSEQVAEVAACEREHGATPVRLLAQRGVLSERFTAVHAIHIDEEEMGLLAADRATVCSCPTTERNLGDGIFAARAAMQRGIPIAFGSDSQTQIDPLEDARELEYHLRLQQQQRSLLDGIGGEGLATRLFGCATANGAAALGCQAGELEAGKLADFFTVDLNDVSLASGGAEDLLAAIVFGMQRSAIADVAVGGRFVVRDHRHLQQEEILKEYREVARKVWHAPQLAAK